MKNLEDFDPLKDLGEPVDDGEEIHEADIVPLRDSEEGYRTKVALFQEMWEWAQEEVYYINTLKGWTTVERRDGEMLMLIVTEVAEVCEAMRTGNNSSARIPEITEAEEEMADILIRFMDYAKSKKWDITKALFLKMEYNKTRPYRHGGKLF